MHPDKIIFSQLSIAELSTAISQSVLTTLLPLLPTPVPQSVQLEKSEIYLTRKEVAKQLKISLPTLDKYTKSGKIGAYRFAGKQKRYTQSDVQAWLKKIKNGCTGY